MTYMQSEHTSPYLETVCDAAPHHGQPDAINDESPSATTLRESLAQCDSPAPQENLTVTVDDAQENQPDKAPPQVIVNGRLPNGHYAPGFSGNPSGRTRGNERPLADELYRQLIRRPRRMTAFVNAVIEQAMNGGPGDRVLMAEIMDRLDGKVADTVRETVDRTVFVPQWMKPSEAKR